MKSFVIVLAVLVWSASAAAEVTQRPCPYNCKILRIAKNQCRDWRQGNTCFVEDLRFRSGTSEDASRTDTTERTQESRDSGAQPRTETSRDSSIALEECRQLARSDISDPRVEIEEVTRAGGMFDDDLDVRGTIEGTCLTEAGYFEAGKMVESIEIETSPHFRRFEFAIEADTSERPEIRAYNFRGERDIVPIDRQTTSDERFEEPRARYEDERYDDERRADDRRSEEAERRSDGFLDDIFGR